MGQTLSFFPFDTRFVGPKPQSEIDPVWLAEVEAAGELGIFQKRDGYQAVVPISDRVQIFSRTCNEWTGRFPHIENSIDMMCLPQETLLIGEMTASRDGKDDLDHFGRFVKLKLENSLREQVELGLPHLNLFNILVYRGEDVSHLPFRERLAMLNDLCKKDHPHVSVIKPIRKSFADAKRHSQKMGWEGLVLYDMRAPTTFSLGGKSMLPPRPVGCGKWKLDPEDDFVAVGRRISTSDKYKGLVRDLKIIQYDPVTKKPIHCGFVGTGLTKELKEKLLDESLFPFVLQAKFECRTRKHKVRKARILRVFRDDKRPEECIHPYSIAA